MSIRLSYVVYGCVLVLYGCGGGSSSTPIESNTSVEPAPVERDLASLDDNTVVYTGDMQGAVLTADNIPGFIDLVLSAKTEISIPAPLYFQNDSPETGREYTNETVDCGDGGSIIYNGADIEEEVFQTEYRECRIGSVLTNGVNLLEYTSRTSSEIEYLTTYINLSVIYEGASLAKDMLLGGIAHFYAQRINNTATVTLNYDRIDNAQAVEMRFQELVVSIVYDDISQPLDARLSFAGRLYYSEFGYIDVTTITPLCYSSLSEYATLGTPDCGGEMIFTGRDGAFARLVAISDAQVQLFVDINPVDGTEEASYIVGWSNLDFDTALPSVNE